MGVRLYQYLPGSHFEDSLTTYLDIPWNAFAASRDAFVASCRNVEGNMTGWN
jgi:hypothetical protein